MEFSFNCVFMTSVSVDTSMFNLQFILCLQIMSFYFAFFSYFNHATEYANQHLVSVPSQDKVGGLRQEGHLAQKMAGG